MSNCFAYQKRWTPRGELVNDKRALCSALKIDAARKHHHLGLCGTFRCEFYKPENETHRIRTEDGLR